MRGAGDRLRGALVREMVMLAHFAGWLAATWPSQFLQRNQVWSIPVIQSLHIMGIGVVLGSVLMISLRVLGLAASDRTLAQTQDRFGPWLLWALRLLLATGLLLIVAEPVRELLAFSFWLKMALIACAIGLYLWFQRSVHRHEAAWEGALTQRTAVRVMVGLAFLIWIAIIFLGRFIAYDHVWGALSGSAKA